MERLKTGVILLLLAALAGSIAWAATSGEANEYVYGELLGLDPEQITELMISGALG